MPVSWVSTGTRRTGNQAATSRSTEMNVSASPAPTSTRATMASGSTVVNASRSCPAAITVAPIAMRAREPKRSSSSPTGTCNPA